MRSFLLNAHFALGATILGGALACAIDTTGDRASSSRTAVARRAAQVQALAHAPAVVPEVAPEVAPAAQALNATAGPDRDLG